MSVRLIENLCGLDFGPAVKRSVYGRRGKKQLENQLVLGRGSVFVFVASGVDHVEHAASVVSELCCRIFLPSKIVRKCFAPHESSSNGEAFVFERIADAGIASP